MSEVLERERGIEVRVRRDRSGQEDARSYYVLADKIEHLLGFRAERGTQKAVLRVDNCELNPR